MKDFNTKLGSHESPLTQRHLLHFSSQTIIGEHLDILGIALIQIKVPGGTYEVCSMV